MTRGSTSVFRQAGSISGLPVLLLLVLVSCATASQEIIFDEIHSTCIDLARYETNNHELTVRFAEGKKFYRYKEVPTEVWAKVKELDAKGSGVGTYFLETVVNHPEKYPYVAIESPVRIRTTPGKKKAEDSK